jgi:hypothetical protein
MVNALVNGERRNLAGHAVGVRTPDASWSMVTQHSRVTRAVVIALPLVGRSCR